MAKRTKTERDIFITAAATLFATVTRDANEIAAMLDTATRTIHRWAKEPRWTEILDTLGYEGERNFRVRPARDVQRDDPDFDTVKTAYFQAQDDGIPKSRCASYVAEITGVKHWKVRYWAGRFGWDA